MNPASERTKPLYTKVEEALHDFSSGIQRLRDQQVKSDQMISQGQEVIDRLKGELSVLTNTREKLKQDFGSLDRFRTEITKECEYLSRAIDETRESAMVKIDSRRHEILDTIRSTRVRLEKELQALVERDKVAKAQFRDDIGSLHEKLAHVEKSYQALARLQDNAIRGLNESIDQSQRAWDSKLRGVYLCLGVVGALAMAAILLVLL